MHLKVVIVSTATVKGPADAKPTLHPGDSASPPFAAMFAALSRLRACARDKDKMKWLYNCQPDIKGSKRLTDMVCRGNGDVSVGSFDVRPHKRSTTMQHCVMRTFKPEEDGLAEYYLWAEGTFTVPLLDNGDDAAPAARRGGNRTIDHRGKVSPRTGRR